MRVATWNVERPSVRSPKNVRRVEVILELAADIVVLTETSRAVDLGDSYRGIFTEPSPRKPREGEAVASIWCRSEVFSALQSLETRDPREAVCVKANGRFGPLIIYGSIIPYRDAKGPDGNAEAWQEHERAIAWHGMDWRDLRHRFPDHELISAGDYNQTRDGSRRYGNHRVRDLLTNALADADLACVTEQDLVASGRSTRHTIDHVCTTPTLAAKVVDVGAWQGTLNGERLSDHNGIYVDFST